MEKIIDIKLVFKVMGLFILSAVLFLIILSISFWIGFVLEKIGLGENLSEFLGWIIMISILFTFLWFYFKTSREKKIKRRKMLEKMGKKQLLKELLKKYGKYSEKDIIDEIMGGFAIRTPY